MKKPLPTKYFWHFLAKKTKYHIQLHLFDAIIPLYIIILRNRRDFDYLW
jgi:hypothetical protein